MFVLLTIACVCAIIAAALLANSESPTIIVSDIKRDGIKTELWDS